MTKERPILFSGPMVRAILEGHKTQTRRVIKPQPPEEMIKGEILGPEMYEPAVVRNGEVVPGDEIFGIYDKWGEWGAKCPYGKPGDLLWVRETWAWYDGINESPHLLYPADNTIIPCVEHGPLYLESAWKDEAMMEYRLDNKWKPSIYMPKWACRLWLEVTGVRVERVQDITQEDARAEGVAAYWDNGRFSTENFATLWDSINAKRGYSWESNPLVWVVEFKVTKHG